jgi:hypothetical protein
MAAEYRCRTPAAAPPGRSDFLPAQDMRQSCPHECAMQLGVEQLPKMRLLKAARGEEGQQSAIQSSAVRVGSLLTPAAPAVAPIRLRKRGAVTATSQSPWIFLASSQRPAKHGSGGRARVKLWSVPRPPSDVRSERRSGLSTWSSCPSPSGRCRRSCTRSSSTTGTQSLARPCLMCFSSPTAPPPPSSTAACSSRKCSGLLLAWLYSQQTLLHSKETWHVTWQRKHAQPCYMAATMLPGCCRVSHMIFREMTTPAGRFKQISIRS